MKSTHPLPMCPHFVFSFCLHIFLDQQASLTSALKLKTLMEVFETALKLCDTKTAPQILGAVQLTPCTDERDISKHVLFKDDHTEGTSGVNKPLFKSKSR